MTVDSAADEIVSVKALSDIGTRIIELHSEDQRQVNGRPFPLILGPSQPDAFSTLQQLSDWIKLNVNVLLRLLRLHGAVLLRGFEPLLSGGAPSFQECVDALGMEPLPYVGGAAPRTNVYKHVFTSNESPPSEKIPFHHEMAQVPTYPSFIFFYAEQPAAKDGATPILRSDELYAKLAQTLPETLACLEAKGLRYTRVLPSTDDPQSPIGRSWPSTFHTQDRSEAALKAKSLGVSLEWLPNGDVKSISSVLPAVKTYPGDSTKIFFNSLVAAYLGWKDVRNCPELAVTYGNGERLVASDVDVMQRTMEDVCVALPWMKGDLLCLDNHLCMHARQTFQPPRRILAYVAK